MCSQRVIPKQVMLYLPWVHQISRWSVDIPPNSSSRNTQHAVYLMERLCLSLNRKRAAPKLIPDQVAVYEKLGGIDRWGKRLTAITLGLGALLLAPSKIKCSSVGKAWVNC